MPSRRWALVFLAGMFAAHTLAVIAYGHLRPERMNIRGIDPVAYYAYFHSLYFDHDLDFANQYELLGMGFVPYYTTATGRTSNHSSIGPALALAPFWLAADVVARLGGWRADGTTAPYHAAAFIGMGSYGLAALLLTGLWCMRRFGPWAGAWAAGLAWGMGPLLYYCFPLTLMPHALGAAATALFFLAVESAQPPSKRSAALGGAALGLAMLMRWQNALFVGYPMALSLGRIWGSTNRRGAARTEAAYWAVLALAAAAAFSPQMAAWQLLFGKPFLVPQGKGYLVFGRFEIVKTLFSPHNGLLVWTPGVGLAAIGLLLAKRGARMAAAGLGVVLLAQLVLNSAALDWHGAWGFSSRRFTESTPIFAFGLGAWLTLRKKRQWRLGATALGVLLVLWNELFIFQFVFHLIAWDQPLTAHEIFGDKFHLGDSHFRRLMIDSAWDHFEAGNPGLALQCIESAIAADPGHDDIYENEGLLYETAGHLPSAIVSYDHALAIRPGCARIAERRAKAEAALAQQLGLPKKPVGSGQ